MKTKPKKILAWHWAKADLKTQHSNEPIAKGKTLKATGPLQLCENGMHASLNPMDALQYAPGPMLCRVELSGEIIQGEDKLCASSRKVLWIANADHMLQEFACLCAERALKADKVDDPRSWRAIEVKRLWLAGKATDAELAAARGAALDAARLRVVGVHEHHRLGHGAVQLGHAARHAAGVPVFELAAGDQHQRVVGVGQLVGADEGGGHQMRTAVAGREVIAEHGGLARVLRVQAGVGDAALALQALPGDAANGRVHGQAHFLEHLGHALMFTRIGP